VESRPLAPVSFSRVNPGMVLLSLLPLSTATGPFLTAKEPWSAEPTSSLRLRLVVPRSPVSSGMVCMSPLVLCTVAGGSLSLSSVESRESRRDTASSFHTGHQQRHSLTPMKCVQVNITLDKLAPCGTDSRFFTTDVYDKFKSRDIKTRTNIKNLAKSNLDNLLWLKNQWSVASSHCKWRKR